MRVMIRRRLVDSFELHDAPFQIDIPLDQLPRNGDQFFIADDRAFAVTVVEWHYPADEVHIFATEYPRESEPTTLSWWQALLSLFFRYRRLSSRVLP